MCIANCRVSRRTKDLPGLPVSGRLGNGKWPLREITQGTIFCVGESELAVVLETPGRRQYAFNTEAIVRGSYPPMNWITVPREEWQGAISNVRQLWIDAGEVLCCEQIEPAQGLIREANQLSCEAA